MKKFKIAVWQNKPFYDKQKNINKAVEIIKKASGDGAGLVLFPEIFYYPYELAKIKAIAEEKEKTLAPLIEAAMKEKIFVCTGSIAEKRAGKIYNSSFLINPEGKIMIEYSKCHLFDVNIPGLKVEESFVFTPGNKVFMAKTELGNIGIIICYDIRFPESVRELAVNGLEILLVPAAFNTITGPAHWHALFRTRAIENQIFIAGSSPALDENSKYKAYGHSLVVDPWGTILAEAGTDESLIYAEIDPASLKNTRERLPLLKHRRNDLKFILN